MKKTFNNDIALLKLNREVTFSQYIRPVCLPTTDRSYNGQNTTVVGWGKLGEGGQPADVLMDVIVPIIPQKKCRRETRWGLNLYVHVAASVPTHYTKDQNELLPLDILDTVPLKSQRT